jgi:hypothetical protein
MARWMSKSIVLWATAFMVLSAWAVMTSAAATSEGPAVGRIAQPAPQWKVNDFFRYQYTQRQVSYQWQVSWGTIPGTCDFTGTVDHYEHYTVSSISDPTWFSVSFTTETWQNGTYIFRPQGFNPSTVGNYRYYDKTVTIPPGEKFRKTDLALGPFTDTQSYTREYTWTSYGKWTNTTQATQTNSYSTTSAPVAWYKFPLDFSQTWQVSGTELTHITGTSISEPDDQGQTHTETFDVTNTQIWTNAQGQTGASAESQDTPAPLGKTFDDCYRIHLSGTYDFSQTGTDTVDNVPQNINYNEPGAWYDTTNWYSNTAGFMVNYNSTSSNNGIKLSDEHYIPIPPNFKPLIETLAGQQYSPSGMAPIVVREGEPTGIDLTVLDMDEGQTLNWSVVSVVGAAGNPQGAQLMDGTPQFSISTPTIPDLNHIHSNTLMVTAKQPRTVDRDQYTVNVNVNDGLDGGNINFSFQVKVQNLNNKPYMAMAVPDITMNENSTMTCTTWKLTDIFHDQDRDAGILDALTFTGVVTSGPQVGITIDSDTGIVIFNVPDYSLDQTPLASWDSSIKFTCTDTGSGNPANKLSNSTNAKLHIIHVNHDPQLSNNGSDLADNGLTWMGDQTDTRLDLNKAYFDPDVKYADDVLAFSWSGQKHIGVKNNNGRITLTPDIYWNGRETIKFKATDKSGRTKELRIDCTVLPVNHAPYFCETEMDVLWSDEQALTIKEAPSPTGTPNKLLLTVSVMDPDTIYGTDTHQDMWYVNDSQGNTIFKDKFSLNNDDYEFRAQFTSDFSASGSPYEVKCVVRDGSGAVATYIWNVTVVNVNRPPTVTVSSPMDNKSFMKGKKISFDAWNSRDLDESEDNLTFIWSSSKQGTIHQDRGQAGAQFPYGSLKAGTHLITLTVQDSDGGSTSYQFTVKVKEPSSTPGFEGVALVASIAVAVALLGYRRRK